MFSSLSLSALGRLQSVQNAAARLLSRSSKWSHITPILKTLHWLPVAYRIRFKILTLTYRALHGQTPAYVADLIHPYTSSRPLRSHRQHLLSVPRTHLKTRGDRAFAAVAPKLWNALPLHLRSADSVDSFKNVLKTFLFGQAFG